MPFTLINKLFQLKNRCKSALENYLDLPLVLNHLVVQNIKSDSKYQDPRHLTPYGFKMYSQTDEDGILREIFNRVGAPHKTFVEFGVENGLENNTVALLLEGWSGLWLECSGEHVRSIQKNLSTIISRGRLNIQQAIVTKENINDLLASHASAENIDLLSIDIDGNDFYVFDALLSSVRPRVIVIEYNAKFIPPILFCMPYNPDHFFDRTDYYGASLKFLEVHFSEKGYTLVGCVITGTNAFFVRNDLVGDAFLTPCTAEMHYEPNRSFLVGLKSGFPPSYKVLNNMS